MKIYSFFMAFFSLALFAQPWDSVNSLFTGGLTGGVGHSWADMDDDGDFDLVINSAGQVPRIWINKVNETGKFENGNHLLPAVSGGSSGWAACFGDFDNDGDPDFHCGNSGRDYLFRNNFPADFDEVGQEYGVDDTDWCQSVNWADYNNDGRIDLYITHELPAGDGPHEFYMNAYPDPFVPRFPQGGGVDTFGLADKNSHAYGLTWGDIDLDGDVDVVTSACGQASTIPNENPHNKIYRNMVSQGIDTFQDMSLLTGLVSPAEVMAGSASYWAMLFDYNGDEFPDLSIGSLANGQHRIWENTARGPGTMSIELVPSVIHNVADGGAFIDGACAGDYDNDGDLDIFTTPGGLYENNGDGSFTRRNALVGPGGQDASFVDYDMDGNLDVFRLSGLFRNPGANANHWIGIELEGDPSTGNSRDAFNVKIRVLVNGVYQYREHRYMVGTYSQHLLPTHFGLGPAAVVDEIQVTWFNGHTSTFTDVAADRYIRIAQGVSCANNVLEVENDSALACQGDSVELVGLNPGPLTVEPRWRVMEGPSFDVSQFSDPESLTTTFTPIASGIYKLGLYSKGCPYEAKVVTIIDTDFDGNGSYGLGDLLFMSAFWAGTERVEDFDINGDGEISILDMLSLCEPLAR